MSSHKDFFFKKVLIQTNYLDENTVDRLLKIQEDLEQEGIKSSLEEIALREGVISKAQLEVIHKQVTNEMNLGATRPLPSMRRNARNLDKKFAHYEVLEEMVHDSLGRLYKARHVKNDTRVAIREFSSKEISKVEIEIFLREVEKCKILENSYIEKIYEVYAEHEPPFYVTELIDGKSFALAKERLSAIRIIEIVHKVAEALNYTHQNNIYHHNLTPNNIMLDEFGEPVIVNFALAETFISEGGISISGTPSYMSPEQATGIQKKIDGQSNVFSLGIIFYEALTGKLPFPGKDAEETISKIQTQEPVPLTRINEEIHKDIQYICLKALAKDRNKRYLTAEAMAADLELYLQGKPIPLTEQKQQRKALWIVSIAIVIAVAIIVKIFIIG